ncbi:MAG: aspartyl protease family protein [Acidobacteriaceae bacterium]
MLGCLLLALSTTLLSPGSQSQRVSPFVSPKRFSPVTVPFEYFNRHIYISLTLNGNPGMVFLVDSGTSSNILNMRTSEALGLKPISVQQKKGLGLGSGKVYVAAAKDIDARIGNVQVANLMAVIDLRGLGEHLDHPLDGILGFPFLQHFAVVLDFDKHLLTLLPSNRYTYSGPGDRLWLTSKSKSTSIPVMLGTLGQPQRRATVEIDTGSDVTLLLYPDYVRGAHLDGAFVAMPNFQSYGLGGYFLMRSGLLQSLLMGRTEASHLAIFQLQSAPAAGSRKDSVGMIGTSLLDQFQKVVFDVPGGFVILELKPVNQVSANRPVVPAFP